MALNLHISEGLASVGGLAITPDGSILYAGGKLSDGSFVLLSASTKPNVSGSSSAYQVVTKTRQLPNGVACDWSKNTLYYTMEGSVSVSGALIAVDLNTGMENIVYDNINGADGAWFDPSTSLLYVGLLTEIKVLVFNTTSSIDNSSFLIGKYDAFSSLGHRHLLDDLTLANVDSNPFEGGAIVLYGADWLGCSLKRFSLDGEVIEVIPPPGRCRFVSSNDQCSLGKGSRFRS